MLKCRIYTLVVFAGLMLTGISWDMSSGTRKRGPVEALAAGVPENSAPSEGCDGSPCEQTGFRDVDTGEAERPIVWISRSGRELHKSGDMDRL